MSREGVRADITQLLRVWIKDVNDLGDHQVVQWYDDHPKRDEPFLAVYLISHFQKLGNLEYEKRTKPTDSSVIQVRATSHRESVAQISAFGDKSVSWLEALDQSLTLPPIRTLLWNNKVNIKPASDIRDQATVENATFEIAQNQDFRLNYRATTDWMDWTKEATSLELSNSHMKEFEGQSVTEQLSLDTTLEFD